MKYSIKLSGLFLIVITLVWSVFSCKGPSEEGSDDGTDSTLGPALPNHFNEDSAYQYVQRQVDFGPRVPGTDAHKACANWMQNMLSKWCDTVYMQTFTAKNHLGNLLNGTNVIGAINPKSNDRLLLCAHWDTRPWADQDTKDSTTPSDGACDGASGVGILLEIARQLHIQKPKMGIDIIFFDLEDGGTYGNDDSKTWCLGSQYWGKHPHVVDYKAKNGILLDMVGAKNALFAREGMSVRFDNDFLGKVWQTAASLNFGNFFVNYNKSGITDDHVFVTFDGKVPTIDIIEFNPKTDGFGEYWHTHNDNMSIIDKNTLLAVGKTVLQVVLNDDAGL